MELYFQIFLMNGKLLQLKADTLERQAQWMAMIKVGLGKGTDVHAWTSWDLGLQQLLLLDYNFSFLTTQFTNYNPLSTSITMIT